MSVYCLKKQIAFLAGVGVLLFQASGAFAGAWVNATGSLAGVTTDCGEIQGMWAVPNVNEVIAGVTENGLWATSDGGTTWAKQGGTTGSAMGFRGTGMVFDPVSPNTWWVCGIYPSSSGIFKTTDAGTTWTPLGPNNAHDGMAVDFSDSQRKLLLAGGHEQTQTLYKSTDGGSNWSNVGSALPGSGYTSFPYIINTQTWLMTVQNAGIYRTTDGGGTWSLACATSPNSTIHQSSTGVLWCIGSQKVLKGSSDGLTWTTINVASYSAAPIEVPGGKIAIVSSTGISLSADLGVTWKTFAHPIPTAITSDNNAVIALVYNSVSGAFYTFAWNCTGFSGYPMPSNEVWRYDTLLTSTAIATSRENSTKMPQAVMKKNALTFDIAGRLINPESSARGLSIHSGSVYFSREVDGACEEHVRE